jgi:hypothetical protein
MCFVEAYSDLNSDGKSDNADVLEVRDDVLDRKQIHLVVLVPVWPSLC